MGEVVKGMLDVLFVNYNSTEALLSCLASMEGMLRGLRATVYVQDNGSSDHPASIEDAFPGVRLTLNPKNLGFAKGVNQGLRLSRAPFVLILNPDTHAGDAEVPLALRYMERNPDVAVLGPKILNSDGTLQASARSFPTPLTAFFGRSSLLSRWFPHNPITTRNLLSLMWDGTEPLSVDWVSGACMLVRRKAIQDVGLLDERFFMYWEDADWCRRMREKGWRVVYFPRSKVIHRVGLSSEQRVIGSLLDFHKSTYKLFAKYNRSVPWILSPLVIGGLALRLPFVWAGSLTRKFVRQAAGPSKGRPRPRDLPQSPPDRIRVLRVIARLNIGGPSIHVHLLTNGLDPNRFASRLVAGRISPSEGDMSYLFEGMTPQKPVIIPELQRELSLVGDIMAFHRIYGILREFRPDIVHTHTAKAGTSARIAALLFKRMSGKRIVLVHTFHGTVFEGYFDPVRSHLFILVERVLGRATDAIIAISDSQRRQLAGTYAIAPEGKIRTIRLGFDLAPFLDNPHKGEFRRVLEIGADVCLVGLIGRMVPIKNHLMLLEAARRVIQERPGVLFVLVGDGELRQDLEIKAAQMGISSHVRFCGWVRDLPPVYADLDVLALTSHNEGTPVSIIEAMAASVPVIATDVGGVPDLLGKREERPGLRGFSVCERGILCAKNDAEGFSRALEWFFSSGIGERGPMVSRARDFVAREYRRTRLLKEIETLYLDLLTS